MRGEEKLVEEQRRHKEIVARLDREKHLEIENYAIRNNSLDQVELIYDIKFKIGLNRPLKYIFFNP